MVQSVTSNSASAVSAGESLRALAAVGVDEQVIVAEVRGDARDAAIVRAMGLTPGACVRVCRVGEPCIVAVMCHRGCHCASGRIGLSRAMAGRVMVKDS